jgi:NADH-quinone oxidoreductase subunit J
VLAGGLLIAWAPIHHSGTNSVALGALPGFPREIGTLLFHEYLLPFEVTSVLVLIAILGAVFLAAKPETPPAPTGRKG